MVKKSPTFHFWALVTELQVQLLIFLSSLRRGDFSLYIQAITRMAPVFFALDQQNYARWLSVHICDMQTLTAVSEQFKQGHFVLQKTTKPFPTLALDQVHKQNNAIMKGEAVGLTNNPAALRQWMICGPEIAHVIQEFERCLEGIAEVLSPEHHEQSPAFQAEFTADVTKLVAVIQEADNSFAERSSDFLNLQGTEMISPSVHDFMKEMLKIGEQQYGSFVEERLKTKTKNFSDPVKRNSLVLIAATKRKKKCKGSYQVTSLKKDACLFSRLYIACQTRQGGLDDFFQHENQAAPPSLFFEGHLRPGLKSNLLDCLEHPNPAETVYPQTDVLILDEAAIVHMVWPGAEKTSQAYAENVFLSYTGHMLQTVSRLDVVWDVYRSNSLKNCTREERGKGKTRRVTANGVIPSNWHTFLWADENKTELFKFLAQYLIKNGNRQDHHHYSRHNCCF